MINDLDRESLVKYRLQQAKDTIELSVFLMESNRLVVAVNRIYYGMYYALTALALNHMFETSKHGQLIGWYNKEFVSQNLTDKKFGKILRNAFQNRTKGDYDAFVEFSLSEVEAMIDDMKLFISDIERLVS
jgi:uncharacterized protein (UPF0332 family)